MHRMWMTKVMGRPKQKTSVVTHIPRELVPFKQTHVANDLSPNPLPYGLHNMLAKLIMQNL